MTEAMASYLRGEQLEALVFITPLGLLSILFGLALLTGSRDPFARGVAVPFVVLGLALVATGATVGLRTPAQVEQLTAAFATDPAAARDAELSRMNGVNRAWPVYLAAWTLFAAGGLALRFVWRAEAAQGVAVALIFFGGVGFLIDGFAERRAHVYVEALRSEPR